jgi:hypothetical protein
MPAIPTTKRVPLAAGDPFLRAREPKEERASAVIQESILASRSHVAVYRQSGHGYALVLSDRKGERLLTVPALNEADFIVHGDPGTTADSLADFIACSISESRADHLRLPLLTHEQAEALRVGLEERLDDWRIATALSAIAPIARKTRAMRLPVPLRHALSHAKNSGHTIQQSSSLPVDEIRSIHGGRWGANRDQSFFAMLTRLLAEDCAELITLRASDGALLSAVVDVLGSSTRHYYYSVANTARASGCGIATLAVSWRRFLESEAESSYSFGRGTERYKFRYADTYRELFELRGFFLPVIAGSPSDEKNRRAC